MIKLFKFIFYHTLFLIVRFISITKNNKIIYGSLFLKLGKIKEKLGKRNYIIKFKRLIFFLIKNIYGI